MNFSWQRLGHPAADAALLIGMVALPLGLATGRPELAVVAAPLVVASLVGLSVAGDPAVTVELAAVAPRLLEGGDPGVVVTLTSKQRATAVVELAISNRRGKHTIRIGFALEPGEPTPHQLPVDTEVWGATTIEVTGITIERLAGLVRQTAAVRLIEQIRVLPRVETLRTVLVPSRTRPTLGNLPSKALGGGLEFAGTRPHRIGDDQRRINWRLSARRNELWVNEHHIERSADVVLFLDALRDPCHDDAYPDGVMIAAVRLADIISRTHLRAQARVGAVSFGTAVRWLRVGMGRRHAYQIVETLIDAEAGARTRRFSRAAIPPRQIPREALVIVVTPLLDHRILTAVEGLRARDQDVAILDIGAPFDDVNDPEDLEVRLVRVARTAARARLSGLGIAVGQWRPGMPVEPALDAIERQRGRTAGRR